MPKPFKKIKSTNVYRRIKNNNDLYTPNKYHSTGFLYFWKIMIKPLLAIILLIVFTGCSSQPIKQSASVPRLGVYGNWCGFDHPRNMSTAGLPINELDTSCMRHDMCYAAKGKFACECDKIFSEELEANLLANKYPAGQTFYARSFYQYFRGSWCNGTPDSKIPASRALHNIYNNTSQKAANIYDYIIGNQEDHAENESAPVVTSREVKKK